MNRDGLGQSKNVVSNEQSDLRMDFSELFKQTGFLCHFSPDNRRLATAVDYRLVIRDAETLQIQHIFNCEDLVSDLGWSADSELVFCCSYQKAVTQVFSLKDLEWTATIDDGASGLTGVKWAPDGRHILTFSDFQHFPVDTIDLENLAWSPDGRYIAVWDMPLEYKILIYFPDGRLVQSFSAYEHGLGIKTVSWAPSSQFLAIGSFDEKPVFKEVNARDIQDFGLQQRWKKAGDSRPRNTYEELRPPATIVTVKPEIDKPNPRKGVGLCEFSCDGRFMATRNDNMPNTLWIWDLVNLCQVALIQQLQPLRHVRWSPLKPNLLAFTCGAGYLYLWGGPGLGCDAVEIPAVEFKVLQLKWSPDGRSVLLMDRDKFGLAYLIDDDVAGGVENSPATAFETLSRHPGQDSPSPANKGADQRGFARQDGETQGSEADAARSENRGRLNGRPMREPVPTSGSPASEQCGGRHMDDPQDPTLNSSASPGSWPASILKQAAAGRGRVDLEQESRGHRRLPLRFVGRREETEEEGRAGGVGRRMNRRAERVRGSPERGSEDEVGGLVRG
ncbi:hypothetical protein HDU96_007317 [Phlyctochytrium bullatum]|nr:hypothetical protein HDU96_007317 [Phlyctochytrium bullatum]